MTKQNIGTKAVFRKKQSGEVETNSLTCLSNLHETDIDFVIVFHFRYSDFPG